MLSLKKVDTEQTNIISQNISFDFLDISFWLDGIVYSVFRNEFVKLSIYLNITFDFILILGSILECF